MKTTELQIITIEAEITSTTTKNDIVTVFFKTEDEQTRQKLEDFKINLYTSKSGDEFYVMSATRKATYQDLPKQKGGLVFELEDYLLENGNFKSNGLITIDIVVYPSEKSPKGFVAKVANIFGKNIEYLAKGFER